MEYGCIGRSLTHSFSKTIHDMIGCYGYELREIEPDELAAFLAEREFRGVNVTIPYKQEVIPYLDQLSPRAQSIGAVNTIVNRNGLLYGYNTDFGGMQSLLSWMGLDVRGKKALILGSGGTSRTAYAVLESLGADEIFVVSRSAGENTVSYERACTEHDNAQIIINTTPCGMFPDTASQPIDLDRFPQLYGVADAIYNPLRTRLVLQAKEHSVKADGGLYMLVAQAVLAAELFTDQPIPALEAGCIYGQLLAREQNLVLIGMPGSGKTTVGRLLAQRLGRELLDTDDLIVRTTGRPISDTIKDDGEDFFRQLEADIIKEAANKTGVVIATGGGAVLRRENILNLRQNGKLIYLDRPVEQLLPTADRPLADDEEKLRKIYYERLPIYREVADEIVEVLSGSPDKTVQSIIRSLV